MPVCLCIHYILQIYNIFSCYCGCCCCGCCCCYYYSTASLSPFRVFNSVPVCQCGIYLYRYTLCVFACAFFFCFVPLFSPIPFHSVQLIPYIIAIVIISFIFLFISLFVLPFSLSLCPSVSIYLSLSRSLRVYLSLRLHKHSIYLYSSSYTLTVDHRCFVDSREKIKINKNGTEKKKKQNIFIKTG